MLPPTVLGYYLLVALGRGTPFGRLYESVFGAPLVFTWQAAVVAGYARACALARDRRPWTVVAAVENILCRISG